MFILEAPIYRRTETLARTTTLTGSVNLGVEAGGNACRSCMESPMSIKWTNKALIALCLTLAITLVLMVYA